MELLNNSLLAWRDPSNIEEVQSIERILYFASNGEEAWMINLSKKKGLPHSRPMAQVRTAIQTGEATIVTEDPYAYLRTSDAELSHEKCQVRDHLHAILGPYLETYREALLQKSRRGAIILKITQETNWKKKKIYKYLRRYWQSGQLRNAFLPDWHLRGGKNVTKTCTQGKKRGRPKQVVQTNRTTVVGINVDKDMYQRLKRGVDDWYLKTDLSFAAAFHKITTTQFIDGLEFVNGVWVPRPWSSDRLPTQRQAWYVYEKEFLHKPEARKRKIGSHRWNLEERELTGDTATLAPWPGSLYQIDATVGDIYLRSQLDLNRIIGRPVIYLVVDVFSRMIVGFAVLMEGPSWMGALQALESAFMDKVAFCKSLGVDIQPGAWPSAGLPEAITADNGEFLGYNATSLNSLDILLHNTPPYRPDWKFLVECYFRTVQEKLRWVPGYLHPTRERGDKDTRLDGVLTLKDLRQLLIWCIIQYNNHRLLENYPVTKCMIRDDLDLYPSEIWRWGLSANSSRLRWEDPKQIHAILLPRSKARVTRHGLKFKNLYYSCETARNAHWFSQASAKEWDVEVSYDPRSPEVLYLVKEDDRMEACTLLDRMHEDTFRSHDWYEVEDYLAMRAMKQSEAKLTEVHRAVVPRTMQEAIVRAAQENLKEVQVPQSKRAALQGVKDNKRTEREYERALATGQDPVAPTVEEDAEEYIGIDEPAELLRTAAVVRTA
ncbi:MAG: transposase family protein [Nitrospiraceae bacterium]|jgi:hypothetical protein|nr:transposase family protein [Nitrospiraceae bacterium]OQW66025.1 MAG: hypothetical protein BVN29_05925 [Nitrospira sp. ST-bin5]ULA65501.1 MAG: Integrase catalytic domain-containing protein [Nitrospira sp.]